MDRFLLVILGCVLLAVLSGAGGFDLSQENAVKCGGFYHQGTHYLVIKDGGK